MPPRNRLERAPFGVLRALGKDGRGGGGEPLASVREGGTRRGRADGSTYRTCYRLLPRILSGFRPVASVSTAQLPLPSTAPV